MRSPSASIFMRGRELDNSGRSGHDAHDGMRARPPLALPAIRAAKMELLSPPFAHARSCTADRLHGCSGGCGRGPSAGGTSLVPRLSTCSRARPAAGSSSDGGASFRRASGGCASEACCAAHSEDRRLRCAPARAAPPASSVVLVEMRLDMCGTWREVASLPCRFACVCVCMTCVAFVAFVQSCIQ